jgi:hypothetical protein
MSLAKVRKEANHSSWEEFEAEFVPDESTASESSDDTKSTTSSKKSVTRKTAAEKEKEKEEKKAAKEKEKAEKKAEKEAATAAKKAEKEAEKAEKEAEKAKKAAEKEEKKPAIKAASAPAPKKAAGGAGAKASDTETEDKPAKAVKKITVKKVDDASEVIPTVPDDGQAHPVVWKGKSYYMMASGEAWIQNKDKSMGKWAGMFDATKNILDEKAVEPTFDDEEE